MRKPNLYALLTSKFIAVIIVTMLSLPQLFAQESDPSAGKKLFNANCAACHKLNKKAVGPALRGISSKYESEWLYAWIKNSSAMIKSGDAQADAPGCFICVKDYIKKWTMGFWAQDSKTFVVLMKINAIAKPK